MCWRDDVEEDRTCLACGQQYYGPLGHPGCPGPRITNEAFVQLARGSVLSITGRVQPLEGLVATMPKSDYVLMYAVTCDAAAGEAMVHSLKRFAAMDRRDGHIINCAVDGTSFTVAIPLPVGCLGEEHAVCELASIGAATFACALQVLRSVPV
ncbi:MAG: hypothetical protein V1907_01605 [Candidatus Kerfeldbacteria bacterium]